MKKDVEILRQSIRVITQILSESNVKVTQSGMDAYVKADPVTKKPILINLPYLPDDASDELIAAIQGYLDHEVGHVLFSDFSTCGKAQREGQQVAQLHNFIEDAFVEREMAKKFRGSAYNLGSVSSFYLNKFVAGVMNEGDPDKIKRTLIVSAIRALSGQQQYIDFMSDKWHLLDDFKQKVEPFSGELSKTKSSEDCLKVAIKIRDALKSNEPESPEQEEENEAPPSGSKNQSKEKEKGEKGNPNEAGNASNEPDEDSEEDEESQSGEGESEESDDEEGDESNDETEEEESEGDSGGNNDTSEDESEDGGESEGEPEDAPTFDIDSVLSGDSGENGLNAALIKEVVHVAKTADYLVFTDEYDEVAPLDKQYWADETMARRVEDEVMHMTAPIQKDLERAVSAQSLSTWETGRRSGRINPSALSKLVTGDSRVFRKRMINTTKDVAVQLVVDFSGSMCNESKIGLASRSALTLSMVLDRLNISHEIVGFTSKVLPPNVIDELYESQRKHGIRYARYESLVMPVLKTFNERLTMETKRKITGLNTSRFNGLMDYNVDGESIYIAARRLAAQKEAGKIMMVLSDGMPACRGSADMDTHLRETVKQIEKSGINVIGIGMMSNAVKRFYSKSVVVNSISELPTVVTKELKGLLLHK